MYAFCPTFRRRIDLHLAPKSTLIHLLYLIPLRLMCHPLRSLPDLLMLLSLSLRSPWYPRLCLFLIPCFWFLKCLLCNRQMIFMCWMNEINEFIGPPTVYLKPSGHNWWDSWDTHSKIILQMEEGLVGWLSDWIPWQNKNQNHLLLITSSWMHGYVFRMKQNGFNLFPWLFLPWHFQIIKRQNLILTIYQVSFIIWPPEQLW